MVGRVPDSTSDNSDQGERGADQSIVLGRGHNIRPEVIRNIIQRALDPLVVDPIPTNVYITDIVISQDSEGRLSISCEVSYDCERE